MPELTKAKEPFRFCTRLHLSELTGLRAATLSQLLDLIKDKTVNIAEVCKSLAVDATRASFLLRELTTEGLVIKDGRGAEAEYKLVEQE